MDYIWVAIIWLVSGFIHGITGLGSSLVAIPPLSEILDIRTIIPIANFLTIVLCGILAWRFREHCAIKVAIPLLIASFPGSFIGLYVLKYIPTAYLQFFMSILLVSYGLWNLFSKAKPIQERSSLVMAVIFGFLAGLTSSAVSLGGPPLAIYILYAGWQPQKAFATLSLVAVITHGINAILQVFSGLYTPEVIEFTLVSVPSAVLGMFLAFPLIKYVSIQLFRKLLLVLVSVSGIFIGYKAFISLGII